MKNIFALSIILASLTFVSISGCAEEPDPGLSSALSHTRLNGTWEVTECIADTDTSTNTVIVYSSGTATTSNVTYSDITCETVSMMETIATASYIFVFDLAIDETVPGITNATRVNVTNTTDGSADFGKITYDIYAIEDLITLYTGDLSGSNDGSTDALRPTSLSTSVSFTRIL